MATSGDGRRRVGDRVGGRRRGGCRGRLGDRLDGRKVGRRFGPGARLRDRFAVGLRRRVVGGGRRGVSICGLTLWTVGTRPVPGILRRPVGPVAADVGAIRSPGAVRRVDGVGNVAGRIDDQSVTTRRRPDGRTDKIVSDLGGGGRGGRGRGGGLARALVDPRRGGPFVGRRRRVPPIGPRDDARRVAG